MLRIYFILAMLLFTTVSYSAIDTRTRLETGCGPNGCTLVEHNHQGSSCSIVCSGEGYSTCPNCTASISASNNNDISLHNYAKQQIIQGNLTGNQISSDGLWKVNWEKKQNNDVSIVAWSLSQPEPPLWP